MFNDCLQGIRVLDLSQYIPGPFATQILADLGAEVLKVEPPSGDPMRGFMLRDDDGLSPLYKQINAGKQLLELDLKSADHRALFEELVAKADVLLESYRPGVMERLGFGRERLQQLNPRLIHCALSGFGQTGPARLRAGHDLTYLAMSGSLGVSGIAETPAMAFAPVADHAGAMLATTAILAALLRRGASNRGAYLDLSLFEAALFWQSIGLTAAQRPGQALARGRDLLTGGAACYQIYRTADDRFVALAPIEEKFWAAFCQAVERSDWIARQFEAMPQTELIAQVQELFAQRSLAAWQELLTEVDCCFEPVLELAEVAEHPQVQARQLLQRQQQPPRADVLFAAWVDGLPPRPRPELLQLSPEQARSAWSTPAGSVE